MNNKVVRTRIVSGVLMLILMISGTRAEHVIVEITGIENSLKRTVSSAITLGRQNEQERPTLARIKGLYKRARGEITRALESQGYYQPNITSKLTEGGEQEHWLAAFAIEPGPRTRVSQLNFRITGAGNDDGRMQELVRVFPLQEGEPLVHSRYVDGKGLIESLAVERGYFDAAWKQHIIKVDVSGQSAVVELHYDTGPRYRYGRILIPDTVISDTILQGMLPFDTGDPYLATELITLTQTLRDSNYFNDVRVVPATDSLSGGRVPINISVTPRPRNSYSVGLGYGTDTGPRLVGSWDSRYFNRSGHRLETDLRLSPVVSSLSSIYLMPYFRDQDAELGFSTAVSREDTDSRKSNTFKTGVQHLSKRWGWNQTLGLTYQYEDFEVADEREYTNLLIPSIGFSRTVTDNPIYTRNGYRIGMDLRGARSNIVSDLSFLQATVRGKYIEALGDYGRIITRGEFGGTLVSDFEELPASLRFFAGGDTSVRGFDLEALGPKNDAGEVIGGRYKLTGSVEYEHRLTEKWSAAIFSDFGNAFNDLSNYNLEYSAGTGIRWLSPVGLIRVDLAAGISREDDIPIRLHIVVGPDL